MDILEQVEAYATEQGIRVNWLPAWLGWDGTDAELSEFGGVSGEAFVSGQKTVCMYTIEGFDRIVASFMLCHEIGHILDKFDAKRYGTDKLYTLRTEVAAWNKGYEVWSKATGYAVPAQMRDQATKCIETYQVW